MSLIEDCGPFQGLPEDSSVGKRKILPEDQSPNNDSAYGSPAPEDGWGSFDSDDSFLQGEDVKTLYTPKKSPRRKPQDVRIGSWERFLICALKMRLNGFNQQSLESLIPFGALVIVCLACVVLVGTFTTGVDRSSVSLNIENLNGKYKSMAFANAKVAEKIKREEADQPENYPAEDAEGLADTFGEDFFPPLSDELAQPDPEESLKRAKRDEPFRFRKRPQTQGAE